ncbi:bifunctional Delta(1)-pyrroline-2-carboxylate/Delta(1)-piperideine-2-carboxylate reductase [Pollutimonas sp. H1-120]|uniref:bifunctional Delta(1)-pyrroline-2-carboxylate/Delta(1)-piperideine-2- carboxylate reductase n=1 Tax=Pollutimonas sp. H1-120 TaxID=3148824 RepID=UPI003B52F02F
MSTAKPLSVFDAAQTARLLDFADMVDALAKAAADYAAGGIHAPERQVVPFPQGGVMLSMPATAQDIGIHKLVNVVPGNKALGLPTINGVVSVYNSRTGQALAVLDGPTVTARRTAAVSMLGIRTFLARAPRCVALMGSGTQSAGHAQALAALYPGLRTVIIGSSLANAQAFVKAHRSLDLMLAAADSVPADADVVITLTTSAVPVYAQPAQAGRLLIGVGAFKPELAEIAPDTLHHSQVYVDDPAGARHEAGDLIQANLDWSRVGSLATALSQGAPLEKPIVFKTVGCAAWDLAAARCALQKKEYLQLVN